MDGQFFFVLHMLMQISKCHNFALAYSKIQHTHTPFVILWYQYYWNLDNKTLGVIYILTNTVPLLFLCDRIGVIKNIFE